MCPPACQGAPRLGRACTAAGQGPPQGICRDAGLGGRRNWRAAGRGGTRGCACCSAAVCRPSPPPFRHDPSHGWLPPWWLTSRAEAHEGGAVHVPHVAQLLRQGHPRLELRTRVQAVCKRTCGCFLPAARQAPVTRTSSGRCRPEREGTGGASARSAHVHVCLRHARLDLLGRRAVDIGGLVKRALDRHHLRRHSVETRGARVAISGTLEGRRRAAATRRGPRRAGGATRRSPWPWGPSCRAGWPRGC